jgi:hypothetical protein
MHKYSTARRISVVYHTVLIVNRSKTDPYVNTVQHKPVDFIKATPLGYFAHVSITTTFVSALKNYYI